MSKAGELRVDGDRRWSSLMTMSRIGATENGGSHRLALSDEDGEARRLLANWCREAGARLSIDRIGNMFARRACAEDDLPPVMIGSHLDTQPMGGRFDGVLGVLAALEVLRTLDDARIVCRHPIELINWTNEEGARFAPAMIGSGVFAGSADEASALSARDADGHRLGDELERIGFSGAEPVGSRDLTAYFELHIEQGPLLEAEGNEIGVVTAAQGVRWLDIRITGAAGHAGTTPMDRRRDALVGASEIVWSVEEVARAIGSPAVATVGRLSVSPGSRNVIPGSVSFGVDIRHPDAETLTEMTDEIRARAAAAAQSRGLEIVIDEVLSLASAAFDRSCVDAVRNAARIAATGTGTSSPAPVTMLATLPGSRRRRWYSVRA